MVELLVPSVLRRGMEISMRSFSAKQITVGSPTVWNDFVVELTDYANVVNTMYTNLPNIAPYDNMVIANIPYYNNEQERQKTIKSILHRLGAWVFYYFVTFNGYTPTLGTSNGNFNIGFAGLPIFFIVFDGVTPYGVEIILPVQVITNPYNGTLWAYPAFIGFYLSNAKPTDIHCYLVQYPYKTYTDLTDLCVSNANGFAYEVATEIGTKLSVNLYYNGTVQENTYSGDALLDAIIQGFTNSSYSATSTAITASTITLPNGSTYTQSSSYNPAIYVSSTYNSIEYPYTSAGSLPQSLYNVVRVHALLTRFNAINVNTVNSLGKVVPSLNNVTSPPSVDLNIHGNPNQNVSVTVVGNGYNYTVQCNQLWLNDDFLYVNKFGAYTHGGICLTPSGPILIPSGSYLFGDFIHTYHYYKAIGPYGTLVGYQPISYTLLKPTRPTAYNVYVPSVGLITNGSTNKAIVTDSNNANASLNTVQANSQIELYQDHYNTYSSTSFGPIVGVGQINDLGVVGSISALLSLIIGGVITSIR
jgi:hypothetical protein